MDLADLLMDFGIQKNRAKRIGKRMSYNDFNQYFNRLEGLLGFDIAADILKNGEFLKLRGSMMEEYLSLTAKVVSKIHKQAKEMKTKLDSISLGSPERFYTIGSLLDDLDPGEEDLIDIDASKLALTQYSILHANNKQSVNYLNSLIENGYVAVSESEHWVKSGSRSNGARAGNIVIKIGHQLNLISCDLGIERLDHKINFGQRKLIVSEYTRKVLSKIKEDIYSS